MGITVYGPSFSPYVRVAWLALLEKAAIDFTLIEDDQRTSTEYGATLNPFKRVPAYQDEDLVIYESRAIARYAEAKFKDQGTPLLGSSLKQEALINQWMEVEAHEFHPVLKAVCLELWYKPKFGKEPDLAIVKANLEKLDKVLDVYDAQLSKSKYLAGDFFSLADLCHIPLTHIFCTETGKEGSITSRKHVKAWFDDITSRPSWKIVLGNTHTSLFPSTIVPENLSRLEKH